MSLLDVATNGKAKADTEKITEWVGLKLKVEDANELRAKLGTDAEGAQLFRLLLRAYLGK